MIEPQSAFYDQSDNVDELFAALAKFQGAMPTLPRTKGVSISGKSKRTGKPYTLRFNYTPLEDIIETARPHLAENGLHFSQFVTSGPNGVTVCTRVGHASGQYQTCEFRDFPVEARSAKEIGIAVTYVRRYSLGPMLGIATEDDTDAPDLQSDSRSVEYVDPQIARMVGAYAQIGVDRERVEAYKARNDKTFEEMEELFAYLKDNADMEAAILETFGPGPEDRMADAFAGGDLFDKEKESEA